MPTSSIFANFNIKEKKAAELFADSLEKSENDPEIPAASAVYIKDKKSILDFFRKKVEC